MLGVWLSKSSSYANIDQGAVVFAHGVIIIAYIVTYLHIYLFMYFCIFLCIDFN